MLEQAIQGKGAFSRFRQAVHQGELNTLWAAFSDDRQWVAPAPLSANTESARSEPSPRWVRPAADQASGRLGGIRPAVDRRSG